LITWRMKVAPIISIATIDILPRCFIGRSHAE
jgi:hypothetical protein